MDVLFPLTYTTYGSIASEEEPEALNRSHVQHLLETIAGERLLYQFFGFPPDALFETPVQLILAERIRILVSSNLGIPCKCEISFKAGKAKALVYFSSGESLEVTLG